MKPFSPNRRDSIKTLAALGAASTGVLASPFALAQKPITVGVIYVGYPVATLPTPERPVIDVNHITS